MHLIVARPDLGVYLKPIMSSCYLFVHPGLGFEWVGTVQVESNKTTYRYTLATSRSRTPNKYKTPSKPIFEIACFALALTTGLA